MERRDDVQLDKGDLEVEKVLKWIEDRKREAQALVQEEQLKFHKMKLEMQAEIQTSPHPQQAAMASDMQAKLPKLVTTKFDGSFMDWPRFWGQFSETIDKRSVAAITKFSYLRELLETKAKCTVEALPFTPEGYNRAEYPAGEVQEGV